MSEFYLLVAAFLLVTILLGLWRVVRGPTPADRMSASQLFNSTGIGVILLIGAASGEGVAADAGLTFALLAALSTTVFVRCGRRIPNRKRERHDD
ncbi:MAG TPA: monovalent cation/H+ antiporter complex subunit F [Kiloniellales bacterium]|nr:monovalent cation/H+ antiporter complex subunit F [Kiloniellales bacterium]